MKNYIKPTVLPTFVCNQKKFDQERALRILERYAHGNFQLVMNYRIRTAQLFYSNSKESVIAKVEYRKDLEQEFGVKIEK